MVPVKALVALVLFAAAAWPQCRVPVWSDEFDDPAIDRSKWSFQTGAGGWGNHELENYTDRPENAAVRDGRLIITARREEYEGSHYTSARLRTIRKGDWRYGRFEARMRLPVAQGMWPAFWMMPTDSLYGGWPASGEIDIMELIGKFPSRVYGTLHTVNGQGQHVSYGEQIDLASSTFADDFHVFAAEWDPGHLALFLDDQPYNVLDTPFANGGTWPFDQRFHIILNLAVGGDWPGSPDGAAPFPQILEVDSVRVFQKPEDIAIAGPVLVETGTSGVVYQVPSLPGAAYRWTAPDGAAIDGAADSNAVTVNWSDAGGTLTLHLTTACGETDLLLPVTVSANLWLNPAFDDGLRYWSTRAAQSGQAAFSISPDAPDGFSKSARIEVLRAGTNPWDVQLMRPDVPLTASQSYRLTFQGRSLAGPRTLSVAFIDSRDYSGYASRTFALGAGWQQFVYEFRAPATAPAQMNLDLARDTGVYEFTGFRFEKI